VRIGGSLAVAAIAAVAACRLIGPASPKSSLADLAAAVGTQLPFEVRLTGGFRPPAVSRTGAARPSLPPDARIVIAQIEKRASTATADSTVRHALGVAYLVDGDVDRAITTLEDVSSISDQAAPWSDLSAAYLVKAERTPGRRVEYVARALDAAAHSLGAHPTNEARFNRALAIEALAPYVDALRPWDEYLRSETDSAWLQVARRHQTSPSTPADRRASWDERRPMFISRLAAGDRAFVADSIARFPEATLEMFDEQLVEWARAATPSDAGAALANAADLADAWSESTHDPMPRDTVRSLRALSRRPEEAQGAARAQLAYRDAVRNYRADNYDAALASSNTALDGLRRAASPSWAWASLQKATLLFQVRQLDPSLRELTRVEVFAREHGYTTLLGRTLRQRGLTQSKRWRLDEALGAFRDAARAFESAGEREDAVAVDSLIAANLRMLGEHHQSWEYIGRTLDGLGFLRTPLRRYLVLYNTSLFASSQDLLESALLFQDAAVREANARGGGPVAEALIERASLHNRRHDEGSARRDLHEARAVVDAMSDGILKRWHVAEIDVLLSELPTETGEQPHVDELRDAIGFFSRGEPARLPRLYLALARAYRRASQDDQAEDSLARGIVQLEEQHARLDDEALKISYFDESWNLFPEMVAFQATVRHSAAAALEYAERSRARSLVTGTRPIRHAELQQRLPPTVAMIYYVTLPDRLFTWVVTSNDSSLFDYKIDRSSLARDIERYVASLNTDRPVDTEVSAQLYEALIARASEHFAGRRTLVIVPDADMQRLPFATLRNPASGHLLIEDHAVVMSPSATVFGAGIERLRERAGERFDSALLVGDPDTGAETGLTPLPAAEREAIAASRFYPRHEVLTGATATRARFVEEAPRFDLIHFAGHALVNPEYPLLSRMSFAAGRDGGEQSLFAYEISRLRLRNTRLVVLAACSTAVGSVSRGEGAVSLARPFLGTGVPTVIASEWDVDDQATARLFSEFHRALSDVGDPVQALRAAQLSLLRSGDAMLASPRAWGAFVALGATAQ